MSVHDDLRELWEADEGGPLEFAKAALTFAFLFLVLFAWTFVLAAAQ